MTSIQPISIVFNSKTTLVDDGNKLTIDGGSSALVGFENKIGLLDMIESHITFEDNRKFALHPMAQLLLQKINQLVLGYDNDSDANQLSHNEVLENFHGFKFASQASLSRMFARFTKANIAEFLDLNRQLCRLYYRTTKQKFAIIDLDTTHFDTHGKQEKADYNAHYGVYGFQPKIAFDSNGLCLGLELHPGSTYSSNGATKFVAPIIAFLKSCGIEEILVRGDSGFAAPKLYDHCEDSGVYYVIRLKENPRLRYQTRFFQILEDYGESAEDTKRYYDNGTYKAGSWRQERRIAVESFRADKEELVMTQTFIVTNLPDTFTAKGIIDSYRLRGNAENFIKEMKRGFFADKTDSHDFVKNEARMSLGMIAYNIVYLMKSLILPRRLANKTIETIRRKVFKIPARITSHNWNYQVHMDTTFVYKRDYWETMKLVSQMVPIT